MGEADIVNIWRCLNNNKLMYQIIGVFGLIIYG